MLRFPAGISDNHNLTTFLQPDIVIPSLPGVIEWITATPTDLQLTSDFAVERFNSRLDGGYGFSRVAGAGTATYLSRGLKSLPAVEFDGSARLVYDGTFPSGDYSIFVVFQTEEDPMTQMDLLSNNAAPKHQLVITAGNQSRILVGNTPEARATNNDQIVHGQPNLIVASFDASSSTASIQRNSGEIATNVDVGATHTAGDVYLGAASEDGDGSFTGKIAALIIADANWFAPGAGETLATLRKYAQQAFGVPL